MYLLLRPSLKRNYQRNTAILEENKQLETQHNHLIKEISNAKDEAKDLKIRNDQIAANLTQLKDTQTQAANEYYELALQVAETHFNEAIENISSSLEEAREDAKQEYLLTLKDTVNTFEQAITSKIKELSQLEQQVAAERRDIDGLVEASKRRLEQENKLDFYRVQLTNDDIQEIARLREVLPYLRDKTPLNKVIYKVYYERPTTDMIGRVVGPNTVAGIYKITNIQNNMCYVGQAVSLRDRFKQHIKRGVGAEDWTQNKLYPAMYSIGVENFTFEVLEICDRADLNAREDYWQDVFHARDFGYSIK